MQSDRRPTWPVLLVLLAFLGGAAFLVYRGTQDARTSDRASSAHLRHRHSWASPSGSGESWEHHDWGAPDEARDEDHVDGWHHEGVPFDREAMREERRRDPQMWAMHHSFHTDGDAGVAMPFSPIEHEARIVSHEGTLASSPNASCEVRVLPVEAGRFNCLVRVLCGGRVIYPDPDQTAGYAPCDVQDGQPVRAFDDGETSADGDPLVDLDLRAGTLTIEDRGNGVSPFRATLRIGRQI
jgi:hypothetical protein